MKSSKWNSELTLRASPLRMLKNAFYRPFSMRVIHVSIVTTQ